MAKGKGCRLQRKYVPLFHIRFYRRKNFYSFLNLNYFQVLTDPPILFCDEPTTGLDSFSAMSIIKLMKEMSSRGKIVLCTIHQPSSELFAMFQQIILLSDGRIIFIGETKYALEFFQK